jgi:hypothetical protein
MIRKLTIKALALYAACITGGAITGVLVVSLVVRITMPDPNAGDGILALALLMFFFPMGGALGFFSARAILNTSNPK